MDNFYNLMYATDFYKVSHKPQYPENVTKVHSVLVARGANYNDNISKDEFYWFGVKLYLDKLVEFEQWLYVEPLHKIKDAVEEYKKFLDLRLGGDNSVAHWLNLAAHVKKYCALPIRIWAQPERTMQDFQTPLLVIKNTDDNFPWLTSYVETSMLANIWPVTTAANRAKHIRNNIESFMVGYTEEELAGVDFMGHDFSYRGMVGDDAARLVGCGHLSVFKGSDTIPAIKAMEDVYGEVTGFSVPATEHSVMCAGGKATELDTYNRILDIYPSGIVSIVSDTWDYFGVLTKTLPELKDKIMARDGKTVIRPDSGDPVDIVCGAVIKDYSGETSLDSAAFDAVDEAPLFGKTVVFSYDGGYFQCDYETYDEYRAQYNQQPENIREVELTPEQKGTLDLLDETFGHTLDSQGRKLLDSHIGIIYGDGMNQERINQMLTRMTDKGYSPLNIVFGIGAFTYQLTTRDELGFAFKATAVEIDGKWVDIMKDPKTDPGKKSLTGVVDTSDMELVF